MKKIVLLVLCTVSIAFARDGQQTPGESQMAQRQEWMAMTPTEREAYWNSISEQHRQGITAAVNKFNRQIEERKNPSAAAPKD